MTKQLPPHLQKVLDKRDEMLKACGVKQDPAEFLIQCKNDAEKCGDDNALIHAAV